MRLVYTPAFSTHAVCSRVFPAPCIFQQDQSVAYRPMWWLPKKASFRGYSMWRRSCAPKRAEGLFYEESRGDNPRHQLLPNHPLFGNLSSRGSLFPSRLFGHSYVTFPLLCCNTWAYWRSSCRTLDRPTCTHYGVSPFHGIHGMTVTSFCLMQIERHVVGIQGCYIAMS